jgi:prepilin-type processing-associated H-X9-DG protein
MIAIVLGVVGVGGICVIVILIALLLPAVQSARGAARRASSQNNMKQIMLAMHNYHDVWQAFPAAYTEDSQGNRLHSWRTSLLPYFEQQALYGQIDQSQPWDSGMNASAAGTDIIIFRSPSDAAIAPGETSYVAVTGQGFLFDGPNYTRIADIMDGTSNTVAFVEAASPGIQWAEPRDLTEEDLSTLVGPDPGGLNVAFADGSVRFLDASQTDPQTLRALLTIRGGEMVPLGY